jgi:hypothetical protein
VFPRVDQKTENSPFAESFDRLPVGAGPQPARNRTVSPHQDRRLLALVASILTAISSTRFCSRVARRSTGTSMSAIVKVSGFIMGASRHGFPMNPATEVTHSHRKKPSDMIAKWSAGAVATL